MALPLKFQLRLLSLKFFGTRGNLRQYRMNGDSSSGVGKHDWNFYIFQSKLANSFEFKPCSMQELSQKTEDAASILQIVVVSGLGLA